MARWENISSRGSVDDRRGRRLALGGGGLSVTGIAILFLYTYLSGGSLTDVATQIIPQISNISQEDTTQYEGTDSYEVFASTVLGSTNDTWATLFQQSNMTYTPPKLVLFRGATESACGGANSEVGPHYCPYDDTIYLDETFFQAIEQHLGAGSADVAQAYVIAHEVGHHIQNELGNLDSVLREADRTPERAQALAIAQELQADCYAGVWAHSITDQNVFEGGEIQEAIDAAAAVGDDRIQTKTGGRVNPESWTHGSSEDRTQAFLAGYQGGTMETCTMNL